MPLINQKCVIQPTLINLHPDEYSQELHSYSFEVKLDRCAGSCNTINDLSNKVCVPNNTEDLNLIMFNMITGIKESKTLIKHISAIVDVKLMEENLIQINGGKMINANVSVKKVYVYEKDYIWNPAACNFEIGKYLASIMDYSVIVYDEIIYAGEKNFNEKHLTCKTQNFYILLAFLLITIKLLIAFSIYCYLIKYRTKHFLPFRDISRHNIN